MKILLAFLFSFSSIASGLIYHQYNDAVFHGYLLPSAATGQALGSSTFKWEGYFNTINGASVGSILTSARQILTSSPLTGGGDLSADRTIAIPAATNTVNGYMTAADRLSFALKASSTITITPSAPLTGGGDLSTNRTISIPQGSSTVDGYMNHTDMAALFNKAKSTVTISPGTGLTGGGDLSANRTLALADTAVTPGAYTNLNATIDQQGRITAAANGSAGSSTFSVRTVTASGTLSNSDDTILFRCVAACTFTAQTVAGATGKIFRMINGGTTGVTIAPGASTDTFNNDASINLGVDPTSWPSFSMQPQGSSTWLILN